MRILDFLDQVMGGGLIVILFMILGIIFSIFYFFKERHISGSKLISFAKTLIFFTLNLLLLEFLLSVIYFPNGEYFNYGIAGIYYGFSIVLIPAFLYLLFNIAKYLYSSLKEGNK